MRSASGTCVRNVKNSNQKMQFYGWVLADFDFFKQHELQVVKSKNGICVEASALASGSAKEDAADLNSE